MTGPTLMGLETEHCLVLPGARLSDESLRAARNGMARAIVECEPSFHSVRWCYDYPYELYRFEGVVNRVLPNGSRLYDEEGYVESCTAECSDPFQLLAVEHANTARLERITAEAAARHGVPLRLVKSNLEYGSHWPWSTSNACHENYSVSPQLSQELTTPSSRAAREVWLPFLVTRTLFTGAGCVRSRAPLELRPDGASPPPDPRTRPALRLLRLFPPDGRFQLSQRADFLSQVIGLETTRFRSLINTRDEPHADPQRLRRLHVIVGDSNRADLSTFLKCGVSRVVLAMLESGWAGEGLELADPLTAMRTVSRDLSLQAPIARADGGIVTALELQRQLCAQAREYCARGRDELPAWYEVVVGEWERVLSILGQDYLLLRWELDWVAKLALIQEVCDQQNVVADSDEACAVDVCYSTLGDPLFAALRAHHLRRLVPDAEIRALEETPPSTRARDRVAILRTGKVAEINWDVAILTDGSRVHFPHFGGAERGL